MRYLTLIIAVLLMVSCSDDDTVTTDTASDAITDASVSDTVEEVADDFGGKDVPLWDEGVELDSGDEESDGIIGDGDTVDLGSGEGE